MGSNILGVYLQMQSCRSTSPLIQVLISPNVGISSNTTMRLIQ